MYVYVVCVRFSSKYYLHIPKRAGGVARALRRLLRLSGALPRSPEAPGGQDGRDGRDAQDQAWR